MKDVSNNIRDSGLYNMVALIETIQEELALAISMAVSAHSKQFRKDNATPFIVHPLAVMVKMNSHQERVVAVLHDIIEDSDLYPLKFIYDTFGTEIGQAVEAMTKFDKQERYQVYIMRLAKNPLAARVKMEDIKHNMSTLDSIPNPHERDHLEKKWNWALIYLEEALT